MKLSEPVWELSYGEMVGIWQPADAPEPWPRILGEWVNIKPTDRDPNEETRQLSSILANFPIGKTVKLTQVKPNLACATIAAATATLNDSVLTIIFLIDSQARPEYDKENSGLRSSERIGYREERRRSGAGFRHEQWRISGMSTELHVAAADGRMLCI